MTKIVNEFGTFRYNRLPMGVCASGDIFPAKADRILGNIKDVKTYNNDILFLRNERFSNHIEQVIIIFGRLSASGLKLNAPKCNLVKLDSLTMICNNTGRY